MNIQLFANDVLNELIEMKKIGIYVPKKAFDLALDKDEMPEYYGMSPSECASLLIERSNC